MPATSFQRFRPTQSRARSRLAIGLILLLAALLVGARFTGAVFTDAAAVTNNTFTTGIVDISTDETSALVSFSGMVPGDVVTAPLVVSNDGTVQLRYAVTSQTTEDVLAGVLDLTIKEGVTTCTNGGFSATGTVLYGPSDLGGTTAINVIGDPSSGTDSGDRVLDASTSETLCFQVSLPLATSTGQGLTSTATFSFEAEQTANN